VTRSSRNSSRGRPAAEPGIIDIESLDMEARGVGRTAPEGEPGAPDYKPGKVIFVEGALPGERVTYLSYRRKPKFEQAEAIDVLRASPMRAKPQCPHFGKCGGCSMQHLEPRAQIAIKQRVLEDNLARLGKVKAEAILRPIQGPDWGYRFRARLTVRYVPKKGGVLIGFHERRSSYVADMDSCEVLPRHVSDMLVPLRRLVESLSIRERLPQIELAIGAEVTALVLRILEPLTPADEDILRAFAEANHVQFWVQPKGPDTAVPFYPLDPELHYTLPEYQIRMPFKPTDFTQVNHQINRVLVHRALRLLAPASHERVLDLFCGLGNFTLPLARRAGTVMGIEGSTALTERALANAQRNGVAERTEFACRNLFDITPEDIRALGAFDRYLIDPPREGALAVSKALAELAQQGYDGLPKRIVYVSCSPATLARDAGVLVHEAGYRLTLAGVVNMFPHTSHVESMAVFEHDSIGQPWVPTVRVSASDASADQADQGIEGVEAIAGATSGDGVIHDEA